MKAIGIGSVVAALALVLHATPASAEFLYAGTGASACRAESESAEGIKYSSFQLRNASTLPRNIVCAFPLIRENAAANLLPGTGFDVTISLTTGSPTPQEVTCLAEVNNTNGRAQSTKSAVVTSGVGTPIHFTREDLPATHDFATVSLYCSLPANARIGQVRVLQPEFNAL